MDDIGERASTDDQPEIRCREGRRRYGRPAILFGVVTAIAGVIVLAWPFDSIAILTLAASGL